MSAAFRDWIVFLTEPNVLYFLLRGEQLGNDDSRRNCQ